MSQTPFSKLPAVILYYSYKLLSRGSVVMEAYVDTCESRSIKIEERIYRRCRIGQVNSISSLIVSYEYSLNTTTMALLLKQHCL